ncbi:MAG TPA: iron ABC transporter permease [Burkholderiales bacterium]|nr:iron ABC transporter permease [Burkholderiales bacterium]
MTDGLQSAEVSAGRAARRAWRSRPLGALGWTALAVAAFIVAPLVAVVGNVFAPGASTWSHLASTVLPGYVANTALLLLGVAWGVVSIGVLSAWLVTAYRFPGQRVLEWALILPLAMPAYVMAYAYTDWLQFSGPVQSALRAATGWQARAYWFPEIRSLPGAAAMLAFALYPYVYLLARTAFLEQSRSAIEAGRLAGLGAWGTFFRVALPLARPAIAAGTALALMETLADFGVVSYFAVETFTTGIFKAWLSMGDIVAANQLATCLLGFVLIVVALERMNRGAARYHNTTARKHQPPQRLRGAAALLAVAACAAPIVFGFLLPAGILLRLAIVDVDARWGAHVLTLVANSTTAAGITAALAVAIAVVMAYAARLSRSALVAGANRVASLGYAIPGAVIAVGIMVPLGRLDNALAAWLQQVSGADVGLLFTGTIAALVYAYLVRFLAVALQTVEAGLGKVTPSMDDAARSLGLGPATTLRRVHAPLLSASLLTAGLLVFVDTMKELPATFALRPFNFDTLAVAAYHLTKDERLAEAAIPSLLIVAVGLLPLVFVSRRIMRAAG